MNIIKKNFIWNMLGSVTFGFTSLIFLIIVTRINGIANAGIFTYAFSISCVMCSIGSYCSKTFQVTETNINIFDSDYIYNRITTCLLMIICGILFALITTNDLTKLLMIILLTIYRSIDAFTETFHAITQRNGYLYKTGQSMFFKTICLILIFLIVDFVFKNMIIATIFMIVFSIIYFYLIDYRTSKNYFEMKKFSGEKNKLLLKLGFWVFCFAFLSNHVINLPRYMLEIYGNDELQALFGIIVMPASFLAMISSYIVQPFLNDITKYIKEREFDLLRKLNYKLFGSIMIIGILIIIVAYILCIPILEILYNVDLSSQRINLIIILIGAIFYSLVVIVYSNLIAMRKTIFQLIILIISSVISLVINYFLVRNYVIDGAVVSYLLMMLIQAILYCVGLFYIIKKVENSEVV